MRLPPPVRTAVGYWDTVAAGRGACRGPLLFPQLPVGGPCPASTSGGGQALQLGVLQAVQVALKRSRAERLESNCAPAQYRLVA